MKKRIVICDDEVHIPVTTAMAGGWIVWGGGGMPSPGTGPPLSVPASVGCFGQPAVGRANTGTPAHAAGRAAFSFRFPGVLRCADVPRA